MDVTIDVIEHVQNKMPGVTLLVALTTELGTATCVFWTNWDKSLLTITDKEAAFLGMEQRDQEPELTKYKELVKVEVKKIFEK